MTQPCATASVITLADFLLARIAEDEAVARYAAGLGASFIGYDTGDRGDAWRGDAGPYFPARVLAECEAKRRIVEAATEAAVVSHKVLGPLSDLADTTLVNLALPYSDHPDYREEWKP